MADEQDDTTSAAEEDHLERLGLAADAERAAYLLVMTHPDCVTTSGELAPVGRVALAMVQAALRPLTVKTPMDDGQLDRYEQLGRQLGILPDGGHRGMREPQQMRAMLVICEYAGRLQCTDEEAEKRRLAQSCRARLQSIFAASRFEIPSDEMVARLGEWVAGRPIKGQKTAPGILAALNVGRGFVGLSGDPEREADNGDSLRKVWRKSTGA